ncbi:MAG: portal protein [Planctomycetota bacterium]|jgi:hypothetical protein
MAGDNEPTRIGEGTARAAHELEWSNPAEMDDRELLHFIHTQFTAGKQRRARWESKAARQLAWLEGDQGPDSTEPVPSLERIEQEVPEDLPLQYVHPIRVNKLKGVVEQRTALVLGGDLELYSVAASTDDEDVSSAVVGSKLLHYLMHSGHTPTRVRLICAMWRMFGTGIVWIHPVWDPFAGTPEPFKPATDGADDDERAELIERFKQSVADKLGKDPNDVVLQADGSLLVPPGEVRWEFRTGFDITEPEFCNTTEQCDWIIDTRWRSLEHLRFRYGEEKTRGLTPSNTAEEYVADYRRQYGGVEGEEAKRAPAELIEVHSLWRCRRPWCPLGALVIAAGRQKILKKGPHPYKHGELPFLPLQEMPSEHFRPASTVENLMDLQEARNRRRSMMDASLHRSIATKILKEAGIVLRDNAFDDNDRVVEVPEGAVGQGKIKAMDPPKMPYDVYPMDELDRRDIADVANVHDSTSGRMESKQQSGRHAALLQQGDVRATSNARELIRAGMQAAGRQSLMLWHQFVRSDRSVVITGGDLEGEVLTFHGKDLAPNKGEGPVDFNVGVKIGPERDLGETLGLVDTMVNVKAWQPDVREEDRLKIEQLIGELVPSDKDEAARHRRNAAREHARFKSGKDVRVRYGDDDQRHVREHEKWTTTDEFGEMLERDEHKESGKRIDQIVLTHIYEHWLQAADKRLRLEMIGEKVKANLDAELKMGTAEATPEEGAPPSEPMPRMVPGSAAPATAIGA